MGNDTRYILALTRVPLVGSVIAKSLIAYCGSAETVFGCSKKDLMAVPGVGEKIADSILKADVAALSDEDIIYADKHGLQLLSFFDDRYPKRLKQYEDAPLILYYHGKASLNHPRIVSIIGTRSPTDHGKIQCEKLVQGLKKYNVAIVSGLAHGIDSCAHQSAVNNGIPTIGVLGHGLDRIYPASNKKLSRKMLEHGGLLTEFPSGTNPDRENFPQRNRIIAGMCDALVVVESAVRGGSIITAEYANKYYKDVFAFPGRNMDNFSQGCNALIKQHKASLIQSAEDIAYILRWEKKASKSEQAHLFLSMSPEEKQIFEILKTHRELPLDRLHNCTGIALGLLSSTLLEMEFRGQIKTLPGKRYALLM